jgi:hypothetical protein
MFMARRLKLRTGLCAAAIAAWALAPFTAGAGVTATVTYSPIGLPAQSGAVNNLTIPTADLGVFNSSTSDVISGSSGGTVTITGNNSSGTGVGGTTNYNYGGTYYSYPAAIVQGTSNAAPPGPSGAYAAPVTGGTSANPTYYSGPYLSTGLGSITLTFSSAQSYLGFLWGSIGAGDQLDFYNGTTDIATVTGAQAIASAAGFNGASGAQGYGGSQYTLVNLTGGTFTSVVLSDQVQSQYGAAIPSFESAGFQYAATNQVAPVPEPANAAIFGAGLLGLALLRRRARSHIGNVK